jgi:hypothetical protein
LVTWQRQLFERALQCLSDSARCAGAPASRRLDRHAQRAGEGCIFGGLDLDDQGSLRSVGLKLVQ